MMFTSDDREKNVINICIYCLSCNIFATKSALCKSEIDMGSLLHWVVLSGSPIPLNRGPVELPCRQLPVRA